MSRALLLTAFLVALPVAGQQSASYKLEEHVFNAGGDPHMGTFAASASYRIKLDSLGEGVIGSAPSSPSFGIDGGFTGAYPPPGEVLDLFFDSKALLSWRPEKSVGVYGLYRDLVSTLPGAYGSCVESSIAQAFTTDASTPAASACFFYLVTAKNRLGEEGTKGYRSSGTERPNPVPCP